MAKKTRRPLRNQSTPNWHVPLENSRLGHAQFLQIAYGFVLDETASETARRSGVSLRTVNDIYRMLRLRLIREVPTILRPAYEQEPEMFRYMVDWTHEYRRREHRGWRKDTEAVHLAETETRVLARNHGQFWLLAVLLHSLYEDRPERV